MSFTLSSGSPSQPKLPPSPSFSDTFTLNTPPKTDIWRKPHPLTDTFNAPRYLTTIPLKQLESFQVTVKGTWKTLFDQGGLLMVLPAREAEKLQWIKTGIEFFNGEPHISAVACDRWADWSLLPLPTSEMKEVTIRMEREMDPESGERTSTMWIRYLNLESRQWMPIREIAWVFEHEEGEVQLGVYAAKPTPDHDDAEGELEVEFKGLGIKRW